MLKAATTCITTTDQNEIQCLPVGSCWVVSSVTDGKLAATDGRKNTKVVSPPTFFVIIGAA
jgi:hypothetical protein